MSALLLDAVSGFPRPCLPSCLPSCFRLLHGVSGFPGPCLPSLPSCLSCCRMLCPPSRALVFLLVSLLFFVLVSLLVSVCWMLLPPSGGLVWLVFLPVSLLVSRCWMLYPSFGGLVSLVSLLVSLCCMLCPPTQGLLSLASSPLGVGHCVCLLVSLLVSLLASLCWMVRLPSRRSLLVSLCWMPSPHFGHLVSLFPSCFLSPCLSPFLFSCFGWCEPCGGLSPFFAFVLVSHFRIAVCLSGALSAFRRPCLSCLPSCLRLLDAVSAFRRPCAPCVSSCFHFVGCQVCLPVALFPCFPLSPFVVSTFRRPCLACLHSCLLVSLCPMLCPPSRGLPCLPCCFPLMPCLFQGLVSPFSFSSFVGCCVRLSEALSPFLSPLCFPFCWMLCPLFRGLVSLVSLLAPPCWMLCPRCQGLLTFLVSALVFFSCLFLPFAAYCVCLAKALSPFPSCLPLLEAVLPLLPEALSPFLSPFFFHFVGCCVGGFVSLPSLSWFMCPCSRCRVCFLVSLRVSVLVSLLVSLCWMLCPPYGGRVSLLASLCGMPPPHLVSLVPPSCIVSLDWMLWPPFGGLVFLASLHVSFVLDAVSAFRRPCLPCLSSCFPSIGSRASAFRRSCLCSCFRSCFPVVGCRVAIPRPCLPCIACCSQQQEAVGFQFLEARGGIAFRLLLIIRSGNLGPLPPSVSHFVSRLRFPFTTLETCLPALSPSLSLLSVALCLTPANSCNLVCRFASQLGSLCVVFFSVCHRVSPLCLPACLPVCVPSGNCFPPFLLLVSQLVSHGVPYVSPTWNLGTLPAALSFTSSPTCLPACLSLCRTLSLEPCLPLCLPPCLPLALQPFLFPTLFPPGCSWACFPLCLPGGTLSTTGSSTVFLDVFPGFPTWTLSAAVSPLELWEPCLCSLFCLRLSLPPLLSQLSPPVSSMVASKSSPVVFLLSACSCSLSPNLSHLCPTSVSQLVSCFCVFHYSAMSLTVSFSLSPVLFPTLFPLGLKLCLWLCLPACLPFYPPACPPLCPPLCLQLVLSPCLLSANCVSIVARFVSHLFQALFPALYPLCPPLCLPLFPTLSLALSPTLSPALSLTLSSAFVCLLLCFPLGDLSGCKASLRSLFPLCLGLCFWLCLPACLPLCLPAYLPLCQLCLNCLRFVSHFFQTFSLPLCLCTA